MPPGDEPSPQELIARAACLDVVEAFYRLVDEGRAVEAGPLFTDDAVLDTDRRYSGKEEIAGFLTARDKRGSKSLHVLSGANFRLVNDGEVEVHAVVSLYVRAEDGSPRFERAGMYNHRCVRRGGRWLIASRDSRRHPISAD